MALILFRPFDIGKWFALGFSAWLASLGEGGGGSYSGGSGNFGGGGEEGGDITMDGMLTGMEEAWAPVREFFQQYGGIVIAIVLVVVLIGVALGIVLLWLRSRGKFMLLDNVLRNRALVTEPWQVWRQHANSLFRWSLGYGIICLLITLGLLALSWPLVIKPCVEARAFVMESAGGIATIVLLFMVFGLVSFFISRFLNDFIVPIMYRHDLTATEAWRKFLGLYHSNMGRFLAYGLFVLVLQLCAGMAMLALILFTCFIAGCLMGIPYIGAVVLLPVTVFFRLYGVEYLAQFGDDFVIEPAGSDDEPDA
jgi:phosphate starvation-inducible membrane PsiE